MSVSAVAEWASIESLAPPPVAPIRRWPPVAVAVPVAGELALVELYASGELRLDELVSRRMGLHELDDGFARLREGTEARQVVVFDDVPKSSVVTDREELHVN